MTTTGFTPEEKHLRVLRLKFWQKTDLTSWRSEIFNGIKKMLTELRSIHYEGEGSRSDQEVVRFFREKLEAFINSSGTKEDEELLQIFQLIPCICFLL